MKKRIAMVGILAILLLAGCSFTGYSVRSFVGTTEPDNPQHRLVTFDDLRGEREAKYDFKSGTAITIELQAMKGKLNFELRSPKGQPIAKLSSSGDLVVKTLDGQFEAGSYALVFTAPKTASGSVKVFVD